MKNFLKLVVAPLLVLIIVGINNRQIQQDGYAFFGPLLLWFPLIFIAMGFYLKEGWHFLMSLILSLLALRLWIGTEGVFYWIYALLASGVYIAHRFKVAWGFLGGLFLGLGVSIYVITKNIVISGYAYVAIILLAPILGIALNFWILKIINSKIPSI